MSQTSTKILLSQTPFTSITNIIGEKQSAASYYLSSKTQQTVTWNLTNVTGLMVIQASLVTEPSNSDSDWFTVYTLLCSSMTQSSFANIVGNYVWMRAKMMSFSSGVIQNIKLSY